MKVTTGLAVIGPTDRDVLAYVEARNVGRAPITVMSCGYRHPHKKGNWFFMAREAASADLPHRLEPGAQATWCISWETVKQLVRNEGATTMRLRPLVKLGNGKQELGEATEVKTV